MADDLCQGCQMDEYSHYQDPDWIRKYMNMQWKDEVREALAQTEFIMVKGISFLILLKMIKGQWR